MRFLSYIKEEYCCRFESYGNDVEIYINPDTDEIKEIVQNHDELKRGWEASIRFTADNKNKKLFVWDGFTTNHREAGAYLNRKHFIKVEAANIADDPNFFNAIAAATPNGKMTIEECDDRIYGDMIGKMALDWDWLKPYFTNYTSYMARLKKTYAGK